MAKMGYQINPAKKHVLEDSLAYDFKQEVEKKAKETEEKNNK